MAIKRAYRGMGGGVQRAVTMATHADARRALGDKLRPFLLDSAWTARGELKRHRSLWKNGADTCDKATAVWPWRGSAGGSVERGGLRREGEARENPARVPRERCSDYVKGSVILSA